MRVVLERKIPARNMFEHGRDVLALVTGFCVPAKNKVCAGAGQMLRLWITKQVILIFRLGFGASHPAVRLCFCYGDAFGARGALLVGSKFFNSFSLLLLRYHLKILPHVFVDPKL